MWKCEMVSDKVVQMWRCWLLHLLPPARQRHALIRHIWDSSKKENKTIVLSVDILLFQNGYQFHDLCPNWSELQLQRCEPIINNGLRSLARQTDTYAFGPHLLIYYYHQIWSQIHFLKTWQQLLAAQFGDKSLTFSVHFCPPIGLGKESKITNTITTKVGGKVLYEASSG